ncbi:MAG: hypothetical protein P8Y54_03290 [Xanthomonadales bacterium]
MLRITRTRQFRVSNRMAVLAAMLLVVTAAAGLGDRFDTAQNAEPATMAETNRGAPASETRPEHVRSAAVGKREFRVHLHLFRRH